MADAAVSLRVTVASDSRMFSWGRSAVPLATVRSDPDASRGTIPMRATRLSRR